MKSVVFHLIFLMGVFLPVAAFGQLMDPAFFALPGSSAIVPTGGGGDSMYVRKPQNKKRNPAQEKTKQIDADNEDEKPVEEAKSTQTTSKNTENLLETPQPEMKSKVRDFVLGGDFNFIEAYKNRLDKEDIRHNIFDLSIGSFYFYNQSQSSYFYSNYINSSPGAFVALNLWMTPFLALDVDYRFSLLSTVKDHPTQDNSVSMNQDWLGFGIKFRRFFSMSLNSSSFSVALNYMDHQFTVPATSVYRMKTRSRGPEIVFDLNVASSKHYFWNIGMNIQPYLTYEQTVGSSDFRSGQSNQSMGFGCFIGGEYRLNRGLSPFFKISTQLYRTMFSGPSNGIDPLTGLIANNVVINDSFSSFNVGFKFGR